MNQLGGDPDAIAGALNGSLDDGIHVQVARDRSSVG